MRKLDITKTELERLYYTENLSLNKIAIMLDCARKTLKIHMEHLGVPLKPHKNAAKKKLPPITKEELEKLYIQEQMSMVDIAEKFQRERKTIDYYLDKFGIEKRTQKEVADLAKLVHGFRELEREDLEPLIKQGMLVDDLMAELNAGRSYILKRIHELGLRDLLEINIRKALSEHGKANPISNLITPDTIKKTSETRRKNAEERWSYIDNWQEYRDIAEHVARNHIPNKPEGYHIDHVFSVYDGWHYGVHVADISHPANLRVIPAEENWKKGKKSDITFEQFKNLIGELKEFKKPLQ